MNQQKAQFKQNVETKNTPKNTDLIAFDEEAEDIQEFYSQYSSQIYKDQGSVISDETEKRKKQIRSKFNDYLNNRKSQGLLNVKKNIYNEEEQFDGALIDELGSIEGVELYNSQIEQFIIMFNKKPQNAINEYIRRGIIQIDTPEAIASYLIKIEGLDKQMLGAYFGNNKQHIMKILRSYCQLLKFNKVQFDQAIRQLLGKFRLPGEAQQIQRIIWEFALVFYKANKQDYENADQLFPLAYAIIMLATDAHNPKQEKKMTREDFIKNTQRPCPSISADYLAGIYDRITKQKFETESSYMETLYARLRGIGSLDFQSMMNLTKDLMTGDVFLKICRNTNKFVQRKIYLSEDEHRIQWVNDPVVGVIQDPRFIQVRDITGLTLGLGSNVMKKNKVPKQFDSLCFTIQTSHRTLDLKAKTNKQRAKWVNYIRGVLIRKREQLKEQVDKSADVSINRQRIEEIWNTDIFPHWDRHWDYKKKKPKQKNVIVRGIQAICCCFSNNSAKDQLQLEGNASGLKLKTSLLDTLWKLGLPKNSRKTLWPLVIGNNLALSQNIVEQLRKKTKRVPEFKSFIFNHQVIEMAEIARQVRPDLPAVRDLVLVSQIFIKAIPKASGSNPTPSFLNLLHMHHFLAFYKGDKGQIDLRLKLFEFLLQKNEPKVKDHFEGLKLETRMYLVSWFLSIFSDCFSQDDEFCLRIWDNFLLEGEIYLFKVGIAIVKYYEVELKMCTFHQGLKILRFPKDTSQILFFDILDSDIDVKQEYYHEYVERRKHAIIKTKVQAIPLE